MGKDDIVIDQHIREMIPPLTDEERVTLEENIKADKEILSPLVVWKEQRILLDGHNRKEIGDRLGIGYRVKEISFDSRAEAENWVDRIQLGRRNLNPDQLSIIRGRIYNRNKGSQGGDQKSKCHNATLISEQDQAIAAAQEFGVSPETIKRDGRYAEAVEKIKKVEPDIEKKVAKGRSNNPKADRKSGKAPPRKTVIRAAKVVDANPKKAKEILDGIAEESKPEPITDEIGHTLPDRANVREAFAARPAFDDLMQRLSRIKSEAVKLGPVAAYLRLQQFEADITNARRAVRFARPHAICPYCKGKANKKDDCNACKGLGWVCESIYTSAPQQMRGAKGAA